MRRSVERRSVEYRRHHGGGGSPGSNNHNADPFHHPNDSYYGGTHQQQHSSHSSLPPQTDYHHHQQQQQHHYGSQLDVPTPPPHGGNWSSSSSRGAPASREQLHRQQSGDSYIHGYEAESPYHAAAEGEVYSPPMKHHQRGEYERGQYVQRPLASHVHAYSPPEVGGCQGTGEYFPNAAYDQGDYERHYPSTEKLVGARGGVYPSI